MSYPSKAILCPSNAIDSSYYSTEPSCEYAIRRPIPYAFEESDDDYVECRMFSTLSSTTSMSQSSSTEDQALPPPILAQLPSRKPPRPALPRSLNVTAYTKGDLYLSYVQSVLTPASAHLARSSLTTILDTKALSYLRKENGAQFDNLIACEISQAEEKKAPLTWVRDVVAPNLALPANFNNTFRDSKLWNSSTESWSALPLQFDEPSLMQWLNWVAHELAIVFKLSENGKLNPKDDRSRSWDNSCATISPEGGTILRKPDLCLLFRQTRQAGIEIKTAWPVIQAFAEVTKKTNTHGQVLRNIVEKAYLMFESQPYRRFVIALRFFGKPPKYKWSLVLVDRSGVIFSNEFNFSGSDGTTLARVLYLLSHGEPNHIGIDETMTTDSNTGIVTDITVTGQTPTQPMVERKFKVVRLLHAATAQISGRATRVWLVSEEGRFYILKDSWPLQSQPFSEIKHLLQINKKIQADTKETRAALAHTYPVLIVGQDFQDITSRHRLELPNKPPPRTHRRIVTEPIGDPLTSFRNKFELCSVLCDVVACKSNYI